MTPALTLADVDFLEKTFDVKPGSRLLDVPCGNGRHSIELARRGYRVTGIDLSNEFLAAPRAELDADWRKGDMRELELEASTFDAETRSEAGDRNRHDRGIDSADDRSEALAPA